MRTMRWMTVAALLVGGACGGAEEEGWEFDTEPKIIWTEPRPGEDGGEERPEEPNDGIDEEPDAPNDPRRPVDPLVERKPTVSPVACDADFDVVTVPGTINGTLERGRGSLQEMPCGIAPGREKRYTIEVPRQMGVELFVEYGDSAFPPILLLQSGCGEDTRDRLCSSPIHSHPPGLSAHMRAQLAAGSYTLVVDERSLDYGEGGQFTIHLNEVDLAPTATCDSPEFLYPDNYGEISTPNTGTTGDIQSCFGMTQSRHFWQVTVPAKQSYRVRAEYEDRDAPQHPYVMIADGCGGVCAGQGNFGDVSVANTTDQPKTYVVGVSDLQNMPYRVFIERSGRLADNAYCEDARHIEANRAVSGELLAGSDWMPICGGNQTRQLFYTVDVPAGHRLVPVSNNATVAVLDDCSGEQVCWQFDVNESAETQRKVIAVGDWNQGDQEFGLTAQVVEVADHAVCENALPVTDRAWGYPFQGRDSTSSCGFVFAGYALYYEVTVPANTTATIEAHGGQNGMNIGVLAGCNGECIASHDTYFNGPGPAVLEVTNDQNTPQTFIVEAASPDGQSLPDDYVVLDVKLP